MPKFSIIVPVYNVEEHLRKCIDSILEQIEEDYEIIIVNDGSTDNSKKIIQEYCKENKAKIQCVNKKHSGLPLSLNKGIEKANGEYILFVDADTYIENNLLKTLDKKLKDSPDMVRFQVKEINGEKVCMYRELPFESVKGETAFKKITKYHYIHNVGLYLYKKEFIDTYYKNLFKYNDLFGFIPLLMLQAKKVKSIGYVGCAVQNKKMELKLSPKEALEQYLVLEKQIGKIEINNLDIFKTYMANTLIKNTVELKSKAYQNYMVLLKNNKLFDYVKEAGFKKWVLCNYPKLYYQILEK